MGWYVTCKTCGLTEKYRHPSCGCQGKREEAIRAKMTGAHIIATSVVEGGVVMHVRSSTADTYVLVSSGHVGEGHCDNIVELSKTIYTMYMTPESSPPGLPLP